MPLDTTTQRTRRALLFGAAGSLAAVASQALGRPEAAAGGATPVYRNMDNPTATETKVTVSNAVPALHGSNASAGTGVRGSAGVGLGVYGKSAHYIGVLGQGDAEYAGVYGRSAAGPGVQGEAKAAGAHSVFGSKTNEGAAVFGEIDAPTSGWGAVVGNSNGTGPGVIGQGLANNRGTWCRAFGTGAGLFGRVTVG